MKSFTRHKTLRAGFTLVEMVISLTLMALVGGTLALSMDQLASMASTVETQANLQTMADDTLRSMVSDLRKSGANLAAAPLYPYVFDGGVPAPAFAAHAHDPADKDAEFGDPDFGLDREVVFLMPADADGDRRPDLDGNGALMWDADEFSFSVRTGADGVNRLERRVNGLDPVTLGTDVERLVVDTAASSGFAIPLGSIRVRLFFRRANKDGGILRYRNEITVAMRNGG